MERILESTFTLGTLFFILSIGFHETIASNVLKIEQLDPSEKKSLKKTFIPYSNEKLEDLVVVDAKHPSAYQLTHHLKGKNERASMNLQFRGDTSTDAVLNAIKGNDKKLENIKYVSTNHFDIDSFTSVWAVLNPQVALTYENIIREIAKIGDFRELRLDNEFQFQALKLICWINSVERNLFYKPFESTISSADGELNCSEKFQFFLKEFGKVLINTNLEMYKKEYFDEYVKVLQGYRILNYTDESTHIGKFPSIGLVIIETPEPVHYYSLFSVTVGFDIVVTCYSKQRYEIEIKYTTFIDLISRPTLPRVDLHPLAKYLNLLELHKTISMNGEGEDVQLAWCANSINDSGPILRIDQVNSKANKMERYDHPYQRNIFSSSISPADFKRIVSSYFNHAYHFSSTKSKYDWTWKEYQSFNDNINWNTWSPYK